MISKIASAGFAMNVVGYDVVTIEDNIFNKFYTNFPDAVANADFVSIHIPDIPATKNFINAERLTQIPAKAILINTARGNIVNENDLYDALSAEKLTSATLDVFKNEPYVPQNPDKDLRDLKNILMTPHIGSSSVEACNRMAQAALRNIELCNNGQLSDMSIIS